MSTMLHDLSTDDVLVTSRRLRRISNRVAHDAGLPDSALGRCGSSCGGRLLLAFPLGTAASERGCEGEAHYSPNSFHPSSRKYTGRGGCELQLGTMVIYGRGNRSGHATIEAARQLLAMQRGGLSTVPLISAYCIATAAR